MVEKYKSHDIEFSFSAPAADPDVDDEEPTI